LRSDRNKDIIDKNLSRDLSVSSIRLSESNRYASVNNLRDGKTFQAMANKLQQEDDRKNAVLQRIVSKNSQYKDFVVEKKAFLWEKLKNSELT
jgi:hypothetical protein